MIELNKNQLNGLRTTCSAKAELTQQEIRNLEGELIKLFGNQLAAKAALTRASSASSSSSSSSFVSELDSYPSVEQWLKVVGVSDNLLQHILESNQWTLEGLLESSVGDVENLVSLAYNDVAEIEASTSNRDGSSDQAPSLSPSVNSAESDQRERIQKIDAERLVDALRSLKFYTERKLAQLTGEKGDGGGGLKENGKIPYRLSSGSESDVGEATSDEDATGCERGGGEGSGRAAEAGGKCEKATVELFWSRWDDDDGKLENAASSSNVYASSSSTASATTGYGGNPATRHHSLSLGHTHGVNNIIITTSPRRGSSFAALQRQQNSLDVLQPALNAGGTVISSAFSRINGDHRPSTSSIPSDELMSADAISSSVGGAPHSQFYYHPVGMESHPNAVQGVTLAPWAPLASSHSTPPETPPPSPLVITSLPYRRCTPPATPPLVRGPMKLPSTPVGGKKAHFSKSHAHALGKDGGASSKAEGGSWVGNLLGSGFPLTKSRSHESQLVNKIDPVDPALLEKATRRTEKLTLVDNFQHGRRLSTEVSGSLVEGPPPTSYQILESPYAASISSMSDGPGPSNLDGEDLSRILADGHKTSPSSSSSSSHKSPKQVVSTAFPHKFAHVLRVLTCQACSRKMLFGMRCKECKYVCHKDCSAKAPLCVPYLVDVYKQFLGSSSSGNSPNLSSRNIAPAFNLIPGPYDPHNVPSYGSAHSTGSHPNIRHSSVPTSRAYASHLGGLNAGPAFPDSSSTASSANSSTPSSPALFLNQGQPMVNPLLAGVACSPRPSPMIVIHQESTTSFRFPDLPADQSQYETSTDTPRDANRLGVDSELSQPSLPQMPVSSLSPVADGGGNKVSASLVSSDPGPQPVSSGENNTDLINTYNSQSSSSGSSSARTAIDSNSSEKTIPDRADSLESREFDPDGTRGHGGFLRQNSLREWDIPFNELDVGTVIGKGRFGTVFRSIWHGEVAVKMLDMDHGGTPETQINQLTAFKSEVANFRKTRHDNLVLFMGACMRPPHLAIVTSLCRGKTLHTLLHEPAHKEKFSMNKIIQIATQTANGVGYLHARGIIHKDLKSKNIFIENMNKVVITDFGLFSLIKLCPHRHELMIPKGWLSYLAPEVLKALNADKQDEDLPFSKATDVYAYGTVWFELITHELPYRRLHPEIHIWQGAKGRLPTPEALEHHPKEVRELLHQCWTTLPDDRITLKVIMEKLETLSKKRLARSPSHPVHLFKSAESVF